MNIKHLFYCEVFIMNKDKFIETKTVAQKIKEDMIRGIINPSLIAGIEEMTQ